jgi:hypothetical protein
MLQFLTAQQLTYKSLMASSSDHGHGHCDRSHSGTVRNLTLFSMPTCIGTLCRISREQNQLKY